MLEQDDYYEKWKHMFNPLNTIETEGYFIRMAGDFSRYMTECSDLFLTRKDTELILALQKKTLRNIKLAKANSIEFTKQQDLNNQRKLKFEPLKSAQRSYYSPEGALASPICEDNLMKSFGLNKPDKQ